MSRPAPYTIRYAPIAEAQIDAALLWWSRNRELAPDLLARELDQALDQIVLIPKAGRRARIRGRARVRRLLLRSSAYHLYYVIDEEEAEIQIVYFRHARRRPLRAK
jgi:hypothetical protein